MLMRRLLTWLMQPLLLVFARRLHSAISAAVKSVEYQ